MKLEDAVDEVTRPASVKVMPSVDFARKMADFDAPKLEALQ